MLARCIEIYDLPVLGAIKSGRMAAPVSNVSPGEFDLIIKLITLLAAAIPVILFLRTVVIGRSKVIREAASAFKKQIDYLVWGILFLVGSALVYSIGTLLSSFWK